MHFELLTLSGAKYQGDVIEVSLNTVKGRLGILPHHEPLTAIVAPGPVIVRPRGDKNEIFATFGGLLEVRENTVRLLADEAEHADELIDEEIEAALKKAEELKAGARDKHELHRAQELIDRHGVRLEVVRLRRRHREHAPKQ